MVPNTLLLSTMLMSLLAAVFAMAGVQHDHQQERGRRADVVGGQAGPCHGPGRTAELVHIAVELESATAARTPDSHSSLHRQNPPGRFEMTDCR